MDAKEFIALLNNPQRVEERSVEELKELSLKYPYSQPLQLLYAIRLSRSSEYLFNRQLGKTSILTDDRSVLFDFFERPNDAASEYPDTGFAEEQDRELAEQTDEDALIAEEEPQPATDPEEEEPDTPAEQPAVYRPLQVVSAEDEEEPQTADETPQETEEEATAKSSAGAPTEEKTEQSAGGEQLPLSAKDRIKAILEENRRLRGEFDTARKEEKKELSAIDQRLQEIKRKLEANRKPGRGADEQQAAEEINRAPAEEEATPTEADLKQEVEREIEEIKEQIETAPEATVSGEGIPAPAEQAGDETAPVTEEQEQYRREEEPSAEAQLPAEQPAAEHGPVAEEDAPVADEIPREEKPEKEQQETQGGASSTEKHSFSEWLKLMKKQPKEGEAQEQQKEKASAAKEKIAPREAAPAAFEDKIELLDTFVEKLPELKKRKPAAPRSEKFAPALHNVHSGNDDSLVTETLARVYIEQKHYEKAIKAYEIMKLKYPEKSGLFAARISEIKKLINSK